MLQRGPGFKEFRLSRSFPPVTKGFKQFRYGPGRLAVRSIVLQELEELRYQLLGKNTTFVNMSGHAVWDGTNDNIHTKSNEDLGVNHLYDPWKNMTKFVKTVAASIRPMQNIFRKEHNGLLNREDFAEALSIRGALRSVITIQILSNQNFVSIEFATQQLMKTFCCEPLQIRDFSICFLPDHKKSRPQKLLNISSLRYHQKPARIY